MWTDRLQEEIKSTFAFVHLREFVGRDSSTQITLPIESAATIAVLVHTPAGLAS